jgi:hypothetical protein
MRLREGVGGRQHCGIMCAAPASARQALLQTFPELLDSILDVLWKIFGHVQFATGFFPLFLGECESSLWHHVIQNVFAGAQGIGLSRNRRSRCEPDGRDAKSEC